MLPEQRAKSCTHDPRQRTARIDVSAGGTATRDAGGTLLLDVHGAIVGVDVEPSSSSRAVIMLGKHESVATTRDVRLSVSRDANGEVAWVVVHGVDAPR
jgi:hypothetical protein